MFGVVLWSDESEEKAVIWCEDHGDLAFYKKLEGEAQPGFDVGDWVQFDLTLERHMRLAHNPRLVAEGVYPDLADNLETTRPNKPHVAELQNQSAARVSAKVIAFAPLPQSAGDTKPRSVGTAHLA